MEAVTGIFTSFDQARRSAEELRARGFSPDQINLLAPGTPGAEVENIPATEGEQPGMGKAVGGVVGAAVGTAAGAPLGMTLAAAVLPGVGPAIAIGLAASALLGIGGAIGGAAAGGRLENALTEGLPKDEVFVYEDALRQGRSVMIALANDGDQAELSRQILQSNGAESIDAAREQWWVGLRDAEKAHYTRDGNNFERDEKEYRRGFEAALHLHTRGSSY
ncbi:MAG: hypothetical protein ACREQO_16930, partial [Candidatus Binatia bacterium]